MRGRFIVKPAHTASNVLAVIIYFTHKIWHSQRPHYFIKAMMPVFYKGYLGGTSYHATRTAEIRLLLDRVPTVLSSLACNL
jgi:hemolysin III